MMNFSIVVIVDKNYGIGKNGVMPWHLPADLKHFATVTTVVHDSKKKNGVIMGRKTWESIPQAHRPLKNRLNVVLSRSHDLQLPVGILLFNALDEALGDLADNTTVENIFVIGGGEVFRQAVNHPLCQKIYLTQINKAFDCDTFFPEIDPKKFRLVQKSHVFIDNGLELRFLVYEKSLTGSRI